MYDEYEYEYEDEDEGHGGALRGVFGAILDGSREPALPSVTDAAVVGGRRTRRRRTAVSGAVGVLVAAALGAGIVATMPTGPGSSSVPLAPLAPANSPPPTGTGPVSPSAVPSDTGARHGRDRLGHRPPGLARAVTTGRQEAEAETEAGNAPGSRTGV
jgi:hypothetical protein